MYSLRINHIFYVLQFIEEARKRAEIEEKERKAKEKQMESERKQQEATVINIINFLSHFFF